MNSLTTADLAALAHALGSMPAAVDDSERIDRIRLLEELKAAACAAQARETVAFKQSQLQAQEAAGIPAAQRGRGIGAQVALARRESPHRGGRLVGLAEALVHEMPHTLAALAAGQISEWRATLVVRETACLTREHRAVVDAELADRLPGYGDRQTEAQTRKIAYRLDPHAFLARARRAVADRHVTLRPTPDTMSILTAILPVAQGVATYKSLQDAAQTAQAAGDERSRGQVMADTLVERITGQATATDVPVEVQLVMPADTAFNGGDQPAHLTGYGPLPAPSARQLVRDTHAEVWLRRLYADHDRLVAMESTARLFPEGLRRFLVTRDQTCRTPWCNAPIRHTDHAIPHQAGGPTTQTNGQGLCEACNHAKQAPGWRARPGPAGAGHEVLTTTPTGHTYRSRPPDPPGRHPHPGSLLETVA